jgi:hypothetical protein
MITANAVAEGIKRGEGPNSLAQAGDAFTKYSVGR